MNQSNDGSEMTTFNERQQVMLKAEKHEQQNGGRAASTWVATMLTAIGLIMRCRSK
jgi:hypothetical protein